MKNNIYTVIAIFLFSAIWCIPSFVEGFQIQNLIFMAAYFVILLCFCLVKDIYVGSLIILAAGILTFVFKQSYLLLVISPLFITCGYACSKKKRAVEKGEKSKQFNFGAFISVIGSIVLIVYRLFIAEDNIMIVSEYNVSHSIVLGLLLFFIITAIFHILKKETYEQKKSKKKSKDLDKKEFKNIYIANVFCFASTVFLYYFTNTFEEYKNIRIVFFPWFLYFCLIVLYDEYTLKGVTENIKGTIRNVIEYGER